MNKPGFAEGFASVASGLRIIHRFRLWHHTIVPALVTILLITSLIFGMYFAWEWLLGLADAAGKSLLATADQPDTGMFLTVIYSIVGASLKGFAFIGFFLKILSYIIAAVYLFPVLAGLVILPFMGGLSEAVEKKLTGNDNVPEALGFWESIAVGFKLSLRLTAKEILFMLVLGGIPVIGQALVFFVNGYFLGIGFFDLSLERHGRSYSERTAWFKDHRLVISGVGAGVNLFTVVLPVFGSILGILGGTAGSVQLYLKAEGSLVH